MSDDHLTDGMLDRLEKAEKRIERLAAHGMSGFDMGQEIAGTLQQITRLTQITTDNQANVSNQVRDFAREIAELKEAVKSAHVKAEELDGKLHRSNGGDAYITRLKRLEEDFGGRSKWKDRGWAAALTVLVAFFVTAGLKKMWPDTPPQKSLIEQLKEPQAVEELRRIFAPPQQSVVEPPVVQQPPPRRPRNANRRPPMPPVSKGILAKWKRDRVARLNRQSYSGDSTKYANGGFQLPSNTDKWRHP